MKTSHLLPEECKAEIRERIAKLEALMKTQPYDYLEDGGITHRWDELQLVLNGKEG